MVLFREDEERMRAKEKADKRARRSKFEIWLRRIFKISLVLGFFFLAGLWLLAALGGDSPELKKGIEDYLQQATGYETNIGTFNAMKFFPDLELDAANITMREPGTDHIMVRVAEVRFAAGFFDLMLSRRRLKEVWIKDLAFRPGPEGRKSLSVAELTLGEDVAGEARPGMRIKGEYLGESFDGWLTMDILTQEGSKEKIYELPDKNDFHAAYKNMKASGHTSRAAKGGMKIEITEFSLPGMALSGDMILKRTSEGHVLTTEFALGESTLRSDLKIAERFLKGDIIFPVLLSQDIAKLNALYDFFAELFPDDEKGPIDLYGWNVDTVLAVEKLIVNDKEIAAVKMALTVNDQQMTATVETGSLTDGIISGEMRLDARALPATLSIEGGLKGWNYAALQEAFGRGTNISGSTADVKIKIKSEGKDWPELRAGLNGEALFVGGAGEFGSGVLDVWGGGLLNAMLPDLATEDKTVMNCLIADFKIESGVASPEPLFMDTADVTVAGEGKINLADSTIDLKLEPKAKDPAILDVASAVRVKGPLFDPKITADSFSLFEKIGGLALGVINPAFTIFTLTDLGLAEDHPCHKFIDKKDP